MKRLSKSKINKLVEEFTEKTNNGIGKSEIKNSLLEKLNENIEKKAILGIDIYRYSQYKTFEQTLIPFLFKVLLEQTFYNCLKHEKYFFQNSNLDEIEKNFIDTGDGGFLIFDNPFNAVIFSIYFQANIKRYNSGHANTKDIREIVGLLTLRYSLTHDDIYKFSNNHYGTGIINNARILSKDKLNRFLVDSNTINWFDKEFNGIENLMSIEPDDFKSIKFFDDYEEIKDEKDRLSVLFDDKTSNFLSVDVLHIGEIKSKLDIINIYSLHLQIQVTSGGNKKFKMYTVSLGNLNSSDL
ncbi:hypothetical protein WNY78_18680 [Psychroserpens sp. AS72]|uniref:hypothetical protein n=1 Tax=Psychroserpens sp. AS72 TaxID=3135775 RepID=UPI00317CC18B